MITAKGHRTMHRMTDPPEDLIAAKDAAELYGVAYYTLRNWWASGKIEKWQRERDGKVYIRRSDVERMTAIRRVDPGRPDTTGGNQAQA